MLKRCLVTLFPVIPAKNKTILMAAFGDVEKPISCRSNFLDSFARRVRIDIIHTVMKFDQPLVGTYRSGQYIVNDGILKSFDVHFQNVG